MKFEDFLARQLRDPAFKAHWEELEAPFQAGNLLLRVRANLDLTQQELADRAGVKRSYVARIENGQANPTVKSLSRILASVGLRLALNAEGMPAAEQARVPGPKRRTRAARSVAAAS